MKHHSRRFWTLITKLHCNLMLHCVGVVGCLLLWVKPDLATDKNVSWRRRAQILTNGGTAERQIGHWKSSLVFSARFPVIKWRFRSAAKSAFYQGGEREEERPWKRGCPCPWGSLSSILSDCPNMGCIGVKVTLSWLFLCVTEWSVRLFKNDSFLLRSWYLMLKSKEINLKYLKFSGYILL